MSVAMTKMTIGKHSMNVVHRTVRRRKRAGARNRGDANRRLIVIESGLCVGQFSERTRQMVEYEKQLHFTKGIRYRQK